MVKQRSTFSIVYIAHCAKRSEKYPKFTQWKQTSKQVWMTIGWMYKPLRSPSQRWRCETDSGADCDWFGWLTGTAFDWQTIYQNEKSSYSRSKKQTEERRHKRFWIRAWLTNERSVQFMQFRHYDQLMRELRLEDTTSFLEAELPFLIGENAPETTFLHWICLKRADPLVHIGDFFTQAELAEGIPSKGLMF